MAGFATVARPYAETLSRIAKADSLSARSEPVPEMGQIAAVSDMKAVTDDPKLSKADVTGISLLVLRSPVSYEVKRLVDLLMANKRPSLPPEIAVQFHVLQNASGGAANVEVISAFPLEGALLTKLVATPECKSGKKLQVHMSVDPLLAGGVRIQVGDEMLDTSARARPTQIQSTLTVA